MQVVIRARQTKEQACLAAAQGTNPQGVLRRCWNNQKYSASKLRFHTQKIYPNIICSLVMWPQKRFAGPVLAKKV
jgi:hypothetical protein